MAAIPVTEDSNILTATIDLASAEEIVNILEKTDSEIFSAYWNGYPSLLHSEIIRKANELAHRLSSALKSTSAKIILSGCGTSGRLGFFTCRKFREVLKHEDRHLFDYIIAGGDKSLLTSQEAPEDDPMLGVACLEQSLENTKNSVFIGITCGLSAPFVAGQLDFAMKQKGCLPVLIGFNPTDMARSNKIEKWDKSFKDVVQTMEKAGKSLIINPVIGPEPITGSSRMRGGTTTKIILDSVFLNAYTTLFSSRTTNCQALFEMFSQNLKGTYANKLILSRYINTAGGCLLSGGRICYLGLDQLGLFGILDATECVPTFGADFNDIRGFVKGGYDLLENKESNLASYGQEFKISFDDFSEDIINKLTGKDFVIVIGEIKSISDSKDLVRTLQNSACKLGLITLINEGQEGNTEASSNHVLDIFPERLMLKIKKPNSGLPEDLDDIFSRCIAEVSVKLIFNAISTGAHILKGKVLQNFMIDVKVSNSKLFYRAISIVQKFSQVDYQNAKTFLLKSLYRTNKLTDDIHDKEVKVHVVKGSQSDLVVPVALLLATGKFSIETAVQALKNNVQVRKCLLDVFKSK